MNLAKPLRGAYLLERRERRSAVVAAEQKAMQAALVRDGRKCRWPACEHRTMKLPIDPCHRRHRGMGGNPAGDRTERASIISLCRVHHGLYDAHLLEIEPLGAEGFDGLCAFYLRDVETGHLDHVATERRIGESVTR